MSGIDSHSGIHGGLGCEAIGLKGGCCVVGIGLKGFGVGFCIEFNTMGPGAFCRRDEFWVGIKEDRNSGPGLFDAMDDLCECCFVHDCIPSGVGGNGIWGVWHEGHLMRFHPFDELQEFFAGVSFDIEFGSHMLGKLDHIGVANMSFIRPRMHCNPLCTKLFAKKCYLQYIGVIAAACISECGNFIDIYGEFRQIYFQHSITKIRG